MLLIDDKVVSLDIVEQFFCCDLDRCLGQCCIEGDAGAPLLPEEVTQLRKALPVVADDLTPSARRVIEEQGVCYRDKDGDLVTSLADGEACVFSTFAPGGKCLCALEKAHREGRLDFCKPIVHSPQLSPLENLQKCRSVRPRKAPACVSGASRTPRQSLRQRVV